MLHPISIHGILERINPPNIIEDIFLDKGFSCTGNHCRRREIVLVHDCLGSKIFFSGRHSPQEANLAVGQCLCQIIKHEAQLSDYV